jgi:hypothetical protein
VCAQIGGDTRTKEGRRGCLGRIDYGDPIAPKVGDPDPALLIVGELQGSIAGEAPDVDVAALVDRDPKCGTKCSSANKASGRRQRCAVRGVLHHGTRFGRRMIDPGP